MDLVNNMSEDAMRQLLRDEVVEQHLKEQAEAERLKAEEEANAEEEKAMNDFFVNRFRNKLRVLETSINLLNLF